MPLGTYQCDTLSEIIVRLTFAVECVTESVGHEILQFRQVLTVKAPEHLQCHWLI